MGWLRMPGPSHPRHGLRYTTCTDSNRVRGYRLPITRLAEARSNPGKRLGKIVYTVFPEVRGTILIVSKKRRPGTLQGMFSDDKTGEIKIASAWPSEKIKSEILYISL